MLVIGLPQDAAESSAEKSKRLSPIHSPPSLLRRSLQRYGGTESIRIRLPAKPENWDRPLLCFYTHILFAVPRNREWWRRVTWLVHGNLRPLALIPVYLP